MPSPTFPLMVETLEAFARHDLTEADLTAQLVALSKIRQAPKPDADWYDAIIRYRGPISDLQKAHRLGLLTCPLWERVMGAMFVAGHEA